ncbi:MAG: hypothetical protein PHR77_15270 [Kiritimatiellae bacterium]|nr:hypothetical protein [Kiritimatiellia bacterium]MDD5523438.1 hypothetical protein [Kiritimatiellia bacterium]
MRRILVGILLSIVFAYGCTTAPQKPQPSQEVTFVTAEPAPKSFVNWTFFWFTPEIEAGAELEYIVIQPDGKEYFRCKIGECQAGGSMRSDFPPGLAKTDPRVFFGKPVTVTFRVNKGTIKFTKDVNFAFETTAKEIRGIKR